MTSSSRWTSNSLLGGGRLTGTLEKPADGRDAWRSAMTSCGKLHPATKRRMDTPLTGSLPVQPQAIMGSGLVDPRRDSGRTVLRDVEER